MVRLAVEGDLAGLVLLAAQNPNNGVLISNPELVQIKLHRHLFHNNYLLFVAEHQQVIVGTAAIELNTSYSVYNLSTKSRETMEDISILCSLMVDSKHRKSGIALELTKARIEHINNTVAIASIRGSSEVGQPSKDSLGAYHNLLRLGFTFNNKIDLLDGGPILEYKSG